MILRLRALLDRKRSFFQGLVLRLRTSFYFELEKALLQVSMLPMVVTPIVG